MEKSMWENKRKNKQIGNRKLIIFKQNSWNYRGLQIIK